MNNKTDSGVLWSFWAIAAVALIWNVLAAMNFFVQMNSDMVAAMPATQRAIIEGRPVWATIGFAIAVFGGSLGGLLLLLRKSAAYNLFILSLLGVIVTVAHTVDIAGSTTAFSFFEILVMILMPLGVAAFFIWYSKQSRSKG